MNNQFANSTKSKPNRQFFDSVLTRHLTTYETKIGQFFLSRVSCREDAEDLKQDVLCAILRSYSRFMWRSSIGTWIYAICKNHLYKYYRDNVNRARMCSYQQHEIASRDRDENAWIALEIALGSLSIQNRRIYTDYYRIRKSIREIAADMDRPEGTIKYMLYTVRRELTRLMG